MVADGARVGVRLQQRHRRRARRVLGRRQPRVFPPKASATMTSGPIRCAASPICSMPTATANEGTHADGLRQRLHQRHRRHGRIRHGAVPALDAETDALVTLANNDGTLGTVAPRDPSTAPRPNLSGMGGFDIVFAPRKATDMAYRDPADGRQRQRRPLQDRPRHRRGHDDGRSGHGRLHRLAVSMSGM